jgi:archaellum biogenesis ATPase FlaH
MTLDETILSHLITNEEYGRKVVPFLREDYFRNRADQTIFNLTKIHIDTYNAFPTKEALFIETDKLKTLSQSDFQETKDKISSLSSDSNTDMQWLLDQTEIFCQEKAIENGIMASIAILDGKDKVHDKGSIPKILQDALAVSFDSNIGHDFLEDWNRRYDVYHHVESKVRFDLDFFNKITGGGFARKTLNVILGGTGVGKTLAMCHMAAANLSQGQNVLYITMEMAEERIAERIDANLLDVKLDDLMLMPKSDYERAVGRVKAKTKGKLIIKEYPTATAGANHFRFLLNELRLKKNFVPDIIYLDYLNLCMSSRIKFTGSVNSFTYVKAIAEELRGLAGEYNVPLVSASQLNRAGFSDSDADITHTSESFGLPMTVDFMVVLISTEELEKLNQYMVKQLKNRYKDPTTLRRFVIGVDRSKMRLYDVEQSAQDIMDGPEADSTPAVGIRTKFDMDKFKDFK